VIFSSAKNKEPAITACSTEYVRSRVNAASLRPTSHPVNALNYHFSFTFKITQYLTSLSAACCFLGSNTAGAFCSFATKWAYANAVIYKISAVYASRQFLLGHFFVSPLHLKLSQNLGIKFSEICFQYSFTKRKEEFLYYLT